VEANMYSNIRSVQIVVALMKQFEIKDVILSPGGSDIPIIHSIETDNFFNCYSVVDERSAVYFAMGMAQELNRPVACVCTSGTAVCNYVPGITEAFYQDVPVLAITADKNPYFQDQLETQKICQNHVFDGVVKKSVDLPLIRTPDDEWLCNRLVNEALIELTHNCRGPVHINIPIVGRTDIYDCEDLPYERKINIVTLDCNTLSNLADKAKDKKILVVVGQNVVFSIDDQTAMSEFFKRTNSVFAIEHLSNLSCDGCVYTYPITEMRPQSSLNFLKPDIVISLGNNLSAYELKPFLRKNHETIENWLIRADGSVRDAYKCLTKIIECSPQMFFKSMLSYLPDVIDTHTYYDAWNEESKKVILPEFTFSNFYVAKRLSEIIPENSVLHTAILNSTRIMQFFKLAKGVKVYSNVGALGIDGCFSTFAGQAAATKNLAFLVIGDLSFFYDMNAAGLNSISNNVRVILLNNGGGSEFQFFMGKKRIPTIDQYICAEHDKVATGWIKSLGYKYYIASTKDELDKVIYTFGQPSDKPMFLEIITDMEEDANKTNTFYDTYRNAYSSGKDNIVKTIKSLMSDKTASKVKRILGILREK